jgi:DNA polymerase-3 subunit delta'
MPFSEIIGQRRAIDGLRGALRRGALHHAYLFAGPEGVGKGTAARLLAQAANCESTRAKRAAEEAGLARRRAEAKPERTNVQGGEPTVLPDDPCGECTPCKKIQRGVHPDVLLLSEERAMVKAGRWEPRAGRTPSKDIVVDQVRDLVDHRLALKRFEGRRRFVIVDPADAMNVQAQNALLKTLEEPPDDTTLVLVAAQADALLPTIRSRCLRVAFAPLPEAVIEERLGAAGRPPQEARLAAALSGGSLGKALILDAEALAERSCAVEKAAALGPGDAGEWIAFARERGSDREAARETCELILVWLRDVLARTAAGGAAPLALADLAAATEQAASRLSPVEVLRRGERVKQALSALTHNASPALALERMLIGWFHG